MPNLRNRIIAGLVALGVAGGGAAGIMGACADADGITMFPQVELTLRESTEGRITETGKVCFRERGDYTIYRNDRMDTYLGKTADERALWLLTEEGQTLDDVLTHEIQQLGTIDIPPLEENADIFLEIINILNS